MVQIHEWSNKSSKAISTYNALRINLTLHFNHFETIKWRYRMVKYIYIPHILVVYKTFKWEFFYYDVFNSALTIKDRCNHSGVNTFHVILVLSLKFLFGAHKKNKYVQCYKWMMIKGISNKFEQWRYRKFKLRPNDIDIALFLFLCLILSKGD